jgi:sulfur-carrier protein
VIRIELPFHLRHLAGVDGEVSLEIEGLVSLEQVLTTLEEQYPALRGTIRDHVTRTRRPFLRFFACERDLSHDPASRPLPEPVLRGEEPLMIVGAIAGG